MKKRFENKKLDEVYFEKKISQASEQVEFLSKTIDDFKEFYIPSKKKESFKVLDALDSALTILSPDLKKHNIDLQLNISTNEDIKVFGIKNELSQVVLAILSNAKDALLNTKNPYIKVDISSNDAEFIISIKDNAGGIKKKNIQKIFDPYFTTKDDGTGIGLYLVKLIVENSFEGKIEFENQKEGACFTLLFEKAVD